ncbi:hypothetical protein ACTXGO_09640 [Psychrobacter sp. T6-1]|uniref:hypothetical protein n=1 Tax=Psychrobacter sp. T6-1 TaxID=3457447 RepID=UPI003FD52E69
MNNNLAVRSMLLDKSTGKLIKAVDERDLSDFLPFITGEAVNKKGIVVFDFAPVIQHFHDELEIKLAKRENQDLAIKRATVFNTWLRLKSTTNETLLCQSSVQVMRDSEEVLNWIHTRIPELEKCYYRADSSNDQKFLSDKTQALIKLSDDIEVFIEILLCNIHTTAKVDIESFKSDVVITEHCKLIQKLVFKALCSELAYFNGKFNCTSLIYACCMEDLGINLEALIGLLDPQDVNAESIRNSVLSTAVIEDVYDHSTCMRRRSVSWPKANHHNLERVKLLSKLLERINLLLILIEKLKSVEVSFNNDFESQSDFENSIQSLLLNHK